MNKRMIVMLTATGLVFGAIFGFKWFGKTMMNRAFDTMPVPPAAVTSAKAERQTWPATIEAVGTVAAVQGITVTTEVAGTVKQIHFQSGQWVRKGQNLVTLDADTDLADLKTFEAQRDLADNDLARLKNLFELDAISKSQLDQAESNAAQARARVEAQRARVDKKFIRASFAGKLGIRQADLGQYVSPGTPLVTLQALDPVYVNFALPEQRLAAVKTGLAVSTTLDNLPGAKFAGRVTAIETRVDDKTRTFNVQATIPNRKQQLQPGQFARVAIALPGEESYIVVPQTAVSYNPYGNSVYVIASAPAATAAKPDARPDAKPAAGKDAGAANASGAPPALRVTRRLIRTGPTRGDLVAITEGLKEGEEVATSGLLKLRNDAPVVVNNTMSPGAKIAPAPPET
jgi:membrane fusion protein (multidrug efflux system)